ncbi:alpha/beta hydrolase [Chryseolinea sp. T2]|uniref:alpha/beta hydrolase n=1 Tax=Chryseolinea sp. T2 TaxID=3129255 RepID=UPI0030782C1B
MNSCFRLFCLAALLTSFMTTANSQSIIKLYADRIPNEIAGPDEEKKAEDGIVRISNISRPTLTVYLPPKEKANGAAVVLCPGGGYGINAFKHEGTDVAEALNKAGIACFILKYRLPSDKIMKDKRIGPLQDAQQAMLLVRSRAKEFNVDPNKIGIAGFSAGGHLASTAGTHYKEVLVDNSAKVSARPDFMILLYPVISFSDSIGHIGSRTNLIGATPSASDVKLYSNELQITADTPPTFLMHAGDDNVVKVANSIHFYESLQRHNVPAELFIYPKGGHGFGLVNPTSPDRWLDRCLDWMRSNKWI